MKYSLYYKLHIKNNYDIETQCKYNTIANSSSQPRDGKLGDTKYKFINTNTTILMMTYLGTIIKTETSVFINMYTYSSQL